MSITKLDQIIEAVKSKTKKKLVAAWAIDAHTIEAVHEAVKAGIVEGILVGDETKIKKACEEMKIDPADFTILHEATDGKAASKAVAMINGGEAQILMKGALSTDKYMRAILNKEEGLLPPGGTLSHVTVIENPNYPKLIICGDVAVLPAPEIKEKIAITNYMIEVGKALRIEKPKVAIIAATEQVSYKMPAVVDACILSKMADRGQIKDAYVDGPLAVDVAIDKESCEIKGLTGVVPGDADCLLFPDIEAGNVFYKTNTKLAGCELAAMVMGAKCPAILSSRGDTAKTKLYSIALAALTAK